MNGTTGGSETAPISTQSQDPASRGVCTCPPPRALQKCVCAWGNLIRGLIQFGYTTNTAVAAQGLLDMASYAQEEILHQRREVYRALAAAHRGTPLSFQLAHQMSRAVFYRLGLRVKDQ